MDFSVVVMAPDAWGFLPAEPTMAVITEDWAAGPIFPLSSEPVEMSCRVPDFPRVAVSSGSQLEGTSGFVTLHFTTGATLRGFSLHEEPRDVNISITASPFFVLTGASNVDASPIGTDGAPAVYLEGPRNIVFALGARRSLSLGHVEYAVQIAVVNPAQYFWQITQEEPWTLALIQGPAPGCRACSPTRFQAPFIGPEIVFRILDFQVAPSSLRLGLPTSVVFSFRLLNAAEQIELLFPGNASSCHFWAPSSLDDWVKDNLRCFAQGDVVRVTRLADAFTQSQNDTSSDMAPLPMGSQLSFRMSVVHPSQPQSDSRGGEWTAQALDSTGAVIGRVPAQESVWLPLYANSVTNFNVAIQDASAGISSAVRVYVTLGMALQPGDFVKVTSPPSFFWDFQATEFLHRLAFDVDADLPVQAPEADGTARELQMRISGAMEPSVAYGFEARVRTPLQPPPDYVWTLETFGPDAGALGQRFETGSLQAFQLRLLTEASIEPWSSVRASSGPVSLSFRTYQAVPAGGALVIRSPEDFQLQEPCTSELLADGNVVAARCQVMSSREAQVRLLEGLTADSSYFVSLYSVINPVEQSWEALRLNIWQLETRDAEQALDGPTSVPGFRIGDELPYGVLMDGGPSTGQDLRAGLQQWVTVAFRVAVPTKSGQVMRLFAEPGSVFEALCRVRDPPDHAAFGAKLIGQQIAACRGVGNYADMEVGAVWQPSYTQSFQVEVRNRIPGNSEAANQAWRLCIGLFEEGGCEQMRTLSEWMRPVLGLQELSISTSSKVMGGLSPILVRLSVSTSMPPHGTLTLMAPSGYTFPLECRGFAPVEEVGYDTLPPATLCQGGGSGRRLLDSLERRLAADSELQLTLGPSESDRILAYRKYAFSASVRNPGRDAQPDSFVWELRTAAGDLLDRSRVEEAGTGSPLLLPFHGSLHPQSTFALQAHSIRIFFRVLSSEEGADSNIVGSLSRIDVYSPTRSLQGGGWDLSEPSACTAPFYAEGGQLASGLVHINVTTSFGAVACAAVNPRQLGIVFTPSVLSTARTASLEFLVRNPREAPKELWNLWHLRLSRLQVPEDLTASLAASYASQPGLFKEQCEAALPGFWVTPTLRSIQLRSSHVSAGERCQVEFTLTPTNEVVPGTIVAVHLPLGFRTLPEQDHEAAFVADNATLELLPLNPGAGDSEVRLLVVSSGKLVFELGLVNTPSPEGSPLWTFELLSEVPGEVLELSSGFEGYSVYLQLEVAGLYGSVREVGYKYNFVRMTFRLPAAASMSGGGTLLVVAPPLFVLDADTFDRENLPPQTVANLDINSASVWNRLNVTTVYPLILARFYSFSFSVANPSTDAVEYWEIWCYEQGRVVAANTQVPRFGLEAFFQMVEVSPSSVIPSQRLNEVELKFVLGSTSLTAGLDGFASVVIQLPSGFSIDESGTPWCQLEVQSFAPQVGNGFLVQPLPRASRCHVRTDAVVIQVPQTLNVDIAFHFQLRLSNPTDIGAANAWHISTEQGSRTVHLAREVGNFDLYPLPEVQLFSTDLRAGFLQLALLQFVPKAHVGRGTLRLTGPQAFLLNCSDGNQTAPRGLLPAEDTECVAGSSYLEMQLPEPSPFAPFQPQLLAGQVYVYGLYCTNPSQFWGSGSFQLEILEPVARLLGAQPFVLAPRLAAPLERLELTPAEIAAPGGMTLVTLRFQAPANAQGLVRVILLEASPGFVLAQSGRCLGFGSRSDVDAVGDTVLPAAACSGSSERQVVVAMPEALPLLDGSGGGRTYVFQIGVTNPVQEVITDLFLLALLPSLTAAPLYAASVPGFAARIPGLRPLEAPQLALAQVPEPSDSQLAPNQPPAAVAGARLAAAPMVLAVAVGLIG
ncbi:unnamed protein product [Effrenium voratum]|uniref:Uncharacterized protein n=1 Tax=Effrenium voratum TaxID=2562239 RepID=A0AA36HTW3_9DINO|nr:unnamed protein product [Effrenium voratum]